MHKFLLAPLIATAGFLLAASTGPVLAGHTDGTVRITPLGVKDGNFCGPDRALLFETPDGTSILFDPGRTVRGPTDSRLPNLDGVLLSSVHQDHLGEKYITSGNCNGSGASVSTTPNSNTAEILAGHPGAFMPAAGELRGFMRAKLADAGGSSNQTDTLRPGGVKMIGSVAVAVIPAFHSNGIGRQFLTGRLLTNPQGLTSDGLTAYVGPDNGFVLTFPNDLVVYLSADTGQFGDMKTIVKEFYSDFLTPAGGLLAVVNMGGKFSMGPEEAAWAVESLLFADAVIPSHANQVSTVDGKVQPGTNLDKFIDAIVAGNNTPVHVPRSGLTMFFDGHGLCVGGPCAPIFP